MEEDESFLPTEWVLATSLRQLTRTYIFHKETKDMSHISEEERKTTLNEKLEKSREMYGYMLHTAQAPGLAYCHSMRAPCSMATSPNALTWIR